MSSMVWNPFCWLLCFIFTWFHIILLRISGLAWVWPLSSRWQPCSGDSKKLKKAKTSMNNNHCFKWSSSECSQSLLCLLPRHLDGHFVLQFSLHTFQYFHILKIAGLSYNFSCIHFKPCRLAASCLSTGACSSLSSWQSVHRKERTWWVGRWFSIVCYLIFSFLIFLSTWSALVFHASKVWIPNHLLLIEV